MARPCQPRYFKSRGAWYCQYQGRQYLLQIGKNDAPTGPDYLAALDRFGQLMLELGCKAAKTRLTVRQVLNLYLEWIPRHRSPATVAMRRQSFAAMPSLWDGIFIDDFNHHHWYVYEASRLERSQHKGKGPGCSPSTVRIHLDSLFACFKWAQRSGIIKYNPLMGIDRPTRRSRGLEYYLSAEQRREAIDESEPNLRAFLMALDNTGARPGEIANATARDFDDSLPGLRYHRDAVRKKDSHRHKTAGKDRTRIIIFSGAALADLRARVARYPSGPLYRNKLGRKWTITNWGHVIGALAKRIGNEHLTAYSFRHSFATDFLLADKRINVLAELMGNTPQVISEHYAHLLADVGQLRDAASAVRSPQLGESFPRLAEGGKEAS